jgi:hypothetical protein
VHAPEDVPLWVPAPVRSNVIAWLKNPQYREHPRDLAILLRLATDPRMRTVWKQLGYAPPLGNTPPSKLTHFFFVAYDCAVHSRVVTTPEQLNQEAAKFSTVVNVGRPWIGEQDARKLDEIARTMRDRSRKLGADPPVAIKDGGRRPPLIVLKQRKDDADVRAYVLELSSVTYKLFRSILLGTVATAASVALQTTVTARQVQEWNSQVGSTSTI